MGLFLDEVSNNPRSGWVIALFAAIAAVVYGALSTVVGILGLSPRGPLSLDDGYLTFNTLVMLIAATVPTVICFFLCQAQVGLPRARWRSDLGLGLALGSGLVALAVVVPAVVGASPLSLPQGAIRPLAFAALGQFFILAPTSIGEELLLRGVVLRQLAHGTRPWLAVLLTGGLFGVMHLVNPSASPLAALNVALVGLWFGILALRFSLWASIGAHLGWNFCEGFVFGQPVSGIEPGLSLFGGTVTPSGFFSGGSFGPEASGLTAVLLAIATVATLAKNLDSHPQVLWKPPT